MSSVAITQDARRQEPTAVYALLVANIALFVADKVLRLGAVRKLYLYHTGWAWWQPLSATFCHASRAHLSGNAFLLLLFGRSVEDELGWGGLLFSYVFCGVLANLLSLAMLPAATVSLGASGAIFGLLGAWGVFLKRNEGVFSPGVVQVSLSGVVQTCALNAVMGMQASSIDNMGHLGGLLGGAAWSFLFGPRLLANPYTGTVVDRPLLQLPGAGSGRRGRRRGRRERR